MRQEIVYAFGPFRLYPERQSLLHDGATVKLGGRAFELLHLLVQRRGELVGKDELIAAAWPGLFVHESNLKVNMHNLRRSLGDTQKQPAYIATIAGRGYRFVAPLRQGMERLADAADPAAEPMRPPPARDLVGRAREIAELLALLRGRRQVTLLGAAGVGKTSIAIAAARALEAECPDGVCFVDLAAIDDPTLLPSALVAALGLRGAIGDALTAVVDHLGRRAMLLLLDNCEHVLPAATIFARKLDGLPGSSRLLATSRAPLGMPSETVLRLDGLAWPEDAGPGPLEDLLRYPAVELFVRRATEWAGYQPVEADGPALARICKALDGLPLAIELVADKLEQHSPAGLLAMLDQHLGFPGRARAAPARHGTLLAAIDWSYGLLAPDEATVFCLVSAFAGAFELEDALALTSAQSMRPLDAIAGLGGLVTKSLLAAEVNGAGLRYRLLDSTRRYAARKRRATGLDVTARRAHALRILALFEQSESEWGWRDGDDWTRTYLARLADVQAALAWAFGDGGAPSIGVDLTVATIPLWFETSLISEAQARVGLALAKAETFGSADLAKAKLAVALAWSMMYARSLVPETEAAWQAAIDFATKAGDLDYRQRALIGLAIYLMDTGRLAEATRRLLASRELSARHRDWSLAPECERTLAWIEAHGGRLKAGLAALEQLAAAHARTGKGVRMAGFHVDRYIGIRCYIPLFAWVAGRPEQAAAVAADAIAAAGRLGHLASQSNVLAMAGCPVAWLSGDTDALARHTARLGAILEQETIGIWLPVQRFFAAALDDLRGDASAIARIGEAIEQVVESRFVMRLPGLLAIQAGLHLRDGRLDRASDAIDLALRHQERQDERWCRPELLRLQALVSGRSGHAERAERQLRAALDEAHAIDALGFELRIGSDLAAIRLEAGRPHEAIALLAPVHGRFREGFATRDLLRAAAILRRAGGLPPPRLRATSQESRRGPRPAAPRPDGRGAGSGC